MKHIKTCALVLCTSFMLGTLAGCHSAKEPVSTTTAGSETITSIEIPTTVESSEASETSTSNEYIIVFDNNAQEYANTFITCFAGNYFKNYEKGKASLEEYLDFAFAYLKYNTNDAIGYKTKGEVSYQTITFAQAMRVAGDMFGTLLKEEDCKALPAPPTTYGDNGDGPYYEDGKIWFMASDGEEQNCIAIVDSARNNLDGTITLNFTVYAINMKTYLDLDEEKIKEYCKMTSDKAQADKTLEKVSTGTATVGVTQTGGYYLISYKTEKSGT
ncbi:MAG: hypothetical protein J5623_00175 [Clostridiales bacterium]|nr:hypothetical protein [Clostridiales bacterium]